MRPISGGTNPYGSGLQPPRRPHAADRPAALRIVPRADAVGEPDVVCSLRVFADGRSITVKRRIAVDPDGTPRTLGIDAVVR